MLSCARRFEGKGYAQFPRLILRSKLSVYGHRNRVVLLRDAHFSLYYPTPASLRRCGKSNAGSVLGDESEDKEEGKGAPYHLISFPG